MQRNRFLYLHKHELAILFLLWRSKWLKPPGRVYKILGSQALLAEKIQESILTPLIKTPDHNGISLIMLA
jgi:hypothetical protein